MNWGNYYICLIALTAWREARGEGVDGMRAVLHVIRNRVMSQRFGDWAMVCTKKFQFSSMSAPNDPELILWPETGDAQFEQAYQLAVAVFAGTDADNTNGATFYFADSIPAPSWAASMRETVKIGHQTFFSSEA
jgi:spore germination cell wall hydrolase CwlJ-like protein